MSSGKYYTLWAKPDLTTRKTLNVYSTKEMEGCVEGRPAKRLTAVKDTLYNPMLPTLRRMDMDEILKKLPENHSRFMTKLSKGKEFLFFIPVLYF